MGNLALYPVPDCRYDWEASKQRGEFRWTDDAAVKKYHFKTNPSKNITHGAAGSCTSARVFGPVVADR
jgi:hypothetical protein